jgi:hypothetical protein
VAELKLNGSAILGLEQRNGSLLARDNPNLPPLLIKLNGLTTLATTEERQEEQRQLGAELLLRERQTYCRSIDREETGVAGGQLVAEMTPEELAAAKEANRRLQEIIDSLKELAAKDKGELEVIVKELVKIESKLHPANDVARIRIGLIRRLLAKLGGEEGAVTKQCAAAALAPKPNGNGAQPMRKIVELVRLRSQKQANQAIRELSQADHATYTALIRLREAWRQNKPAERQAALGYFLGALPEAWPQRQKFLLHLVKTVNLGSDSPEQVALNQAVLLILSGFKEEGYEGLLFLTRWLTLYLNYPDY